MDTPLFILWFPLCRSIARCTGHHQREEIDSRDHRYKVAPYAQCRDDLYNETYSLIDWAIKSNMQSVLSDCPHREKLGWLEQTYLMGESIHFNYDIYSLYKKIVADMMVDQSADGLVPDIAPEFVAFDDGFKDSPEWGSASVILPWLIYQWYGDKTIMQD